MKLLQFLQRLRVGHDVFIHKSNAVFRKKLFRKLAKHSARLRINHHAPTPLHRKHSFPSIDARFQSQKQ